MSLPPLSSLLNSNFAGSSTYAPSFQQVLSRAMQIAALPAQQIQNTISNLTGEKSVMGALQNSFTSLTSAIRNVSAAGAGNLSANASDQSVATATATAEALAGTYTIEVDDLGSSTTTMSKVGLTTVTDPSVDNISTATAFTLKVNGVDHVITPAATSLQSLATAINDAGLGVQATIVNVGSNANTDYRLAITSNNLGADTIQLNDGTQDVLDNLSTGTNASYKVNGLATAIESTSRNITLAPGLTVNLVGEAVGDPVTITVSRDFSLLQNTLATLASSYNSAVDAVSSQRGENAGPLAGQSIVYSLFNSLRSLSQYTSSDSDAVHSLADLGLTLDSTGHLTLDATVFSAVDPKEVQKFLGDVDSGGFAKSANDAIKAMADPITGTLQDSITTLQSQIDSQNDRITLEQTRLQNLQDNLVQQLSAADAAIATLESQKSFFTDLFTAMNANNKNGTNG